MYNDLMSIIDEACLPREEVEGAWNLNHQRTYDLYEPVLKGMYVLESLPASIYYDAAMMYCVDPRILNNSRY